MGEKTSGRYGPVWKVKIHPTHHNFVGHDVSSTYYQADRLRKIHLHGSWSVAKVLDGSTHFADTDKNRGRHGEVKLENILCFKTNEHQYHHLVMSDFGSPRFHSPKAVSRVPLEKVQGISRTYRSPKFDTQPYISQAYDMWGLGCLYLDVISWLLVGYRKTREVVQSQRVEEDIPPASLFAKTNSLISSHVPEILARSIQITRK